MSHPSLLRHPSLESSSPQPSYDGHRASLFDAKDDFIARMGPIGVAAIYFGSFSLAPQEPALARQALLKLSFVYRHLLQPAGIRLEVREQVVTVSGMVRSRPLVALAELLARQIEGVEAVKNETELALEDRPAIARTVEAMNLLLATDQTLRVPIKVGEFEGRLKLVGVVNSDGQKSWAGQLAHLVDGEAQVDLEIRAADFSAKKPDVDDESLQALVLFRLRLVRETEHLSLEAVAHRGVVTLTGQVPTEALRERVEHLARTTLGTLDLSSLVTVSG